jgi:hypothetical protein
LLPNLCSMVWVQVMVRMCRVQNLTDREWVLDSGHPDTQITRNNLAEVYRAVRRTK